MGIFDRIILTIYTFLLTFLSLGVILISLHLVSLDWAWTTIYFINDHWEVSLIGALFLLISIRLLLAGVRSHRGKNRIIHHNDMGDVFISLDAVENLVEKAARNVRGVRNVKVYASHSSAGLKLYLKTVVSPESNVPSVTADIQDRVNNYIKNTVGVELAEIKIFVNNISNDFKARQRVE
jgi:uncharacterized alkaline shock family protein YloU